MEGGLIHREDIIYEQVEEVEYPEERKPALFLKLKNILFEKRYKLLFVSDKFMLIFLIKMKLNNKNEVKNIK